METGMTTTDFVLLDRMDDKHNGKWGQNTALWAIVAILLVLALLWFCHRQGADKADLAASIQGLYGRVNTLEPVVKNNAEQNFRTATSLAGIVQGVSDIRDYTYGEIAALDNAVFQPVCGSRRSSRGCGCGDDRFIKKSIFTPSTVEVEQIESCCG